MLTIRPERWARIAGSTAWVMATRLITLSWSTRANSSRSSRSRGVCRLTPALLTSPSIRPCRSSVASASRRTAVGSVTSVGTASAPSSSSLNTARRSARRAARTGCAPAWWSRRAVAAPMPDEAPVTMTVLPVTSRTSMPSCWPTGWFSSARRRRAFLATLRTVVDPAGQTINATDKLPVMVETPTVIVWGGRDRLIPVRPGRQAHRAIPSSRLEIFPKAGHLPHTAPVRRPAGGLRRAGPAGADRGAARDRQAGPRLGGDVSARTSGIDASAWTAPTRRASATGRRRPTDTAPGSASAAGPDRTASELGYALSAGVRGAFGGDPTRCRGLPMSFWSGYWYWRWVRTADLADDGPDRVGAGAEDLGQPLHRSGEPRRGPRAA